MRTCSQLVYQVKNNNNNLFIDWNCLVGSVDSPDNVNIMSVPYKGIVEMLKTKAWDQASIAEHEATMKKVPQIGFISNEHVSIHSMTMLQHPHLLFILFLCSSYRVTTPYMREASSTWWLALPWVAGVIQLAWVCEELIGNNSFWFRRLNVFKMCLPCNSRKCQLFIHDV